MARGRHPGTPKTGGRQKGTLNRRTIAQLEVAEKAAQLGIMPLDVMLENMRTLYAEGKLGLAHEAAVDAAPYLHPKLATTHSTVNQTTVHVVDDAYERLILEIDRLAAAEGEGESEESAPCLSPEQRIDILYDWAGRARDEQLPPDGDWQKPGA